VADVYDKIGHRGVVTPRVHFDQVRVPAANLIGQPGRPGKRIVAGAFSWTAALIGAACVGTRRAIPGSQAAEIIARWRRLARTAHWRLLRRFGNAALIGREGYRARARVALSMRSPRSSTLASR
jgi:hypothetical protein